jgi:hypothetical protein
MEGKEETRNERERYINRKRKILGQFLTGCGVLHAYSKYRVMMVIDPA